MQVKNEAKRRLLANIVTNLIAIVVTASIGFWLTRYLIQHLGIAAYGMIPLTIQVVAYFDLFSKANQNAVGRFVALHYNRQQNERSNIYFNTALFSVVVLCIVLSIPTVVITVFLPRILEIPAGHEISSRWLFFLVVFSAFITATASPFMVATLIKHRFDLSNSVTIVSKLLRVAIIVLCFAWLGTSLEYVGWSYCGMALFFWGGHVWLRGRLTPQLQVRLKSFRWAAFREMASMSIWMTINQIGTLLYLSTDLIIINLLLGPEKVGQYGPLVLLVMLLSMLGSAVANVFTPIAYEYIAREQQDALVRHAKRSAKLMGLAISLPVGLLLGLSTPFLTWWLGPSFSRLDLLLCLLVGPAVVNITVRPLFSIYRGMNKVEVPALVILSGGIVNVIMSVFLIKYLNLGLYGAALASVLCLTTKNLFFTTIYTATVLGRAKSTFFREIVPGVVIVALLSLAGWGLSRMYDLSTLPRLCGAALPLGIVYLLICYAVALNRGDRRFLLSVVRRR
jgi:membrane protein EpsK